MNILEAAKTLRLNTTVRMVHQLSLVTFDLSELYITVVYPLTTFVLDDGSSWSGIRFDAIRQNAFCTKQLTHTTIGGESINIGIADGTIQIFFPDCRHKSQWYGLPISDWSITSKATRLTGAGIGSVRVHVELTFLHA